MPLEMPSLVFDHALLIDDKAEAIIDAGLTRIAKKYKVQVVKAMEVGPQTGIVYERRSGLGFARRHRASARGEHPAVDTGNLINSVQDQKTEPLTREVYVDDQRAPYGKWLEAERLGRDIMGDAGIASFVDGEMAVELERMHEELVK